MFDQVISKDLLGWQGDPVVFILTMNQLAHYSRFFRIL
jgi:hypothetical protein